MEAGIRMPQRALLKSVTNIETSLEGGSVVAPGAMQIGTRWYQYLKREHAFNVYAALEHLRFESLAELLMSQAPSSGPTLPLHVNMVSPHRLSQNRREKHRKQNFRKEHHPRQGSSMSSLGANVNVSKQRTAQTKQSSRHHRDLVIEEHERCQQEILALLDPIAGKNDSDCSYIFFCWGSKNLCKISAIKVPNSVDDVAVWHVIRQAWYAMRGQWRRYLPLFDVKEVGRVRISIAGPEQRRDEKLCDKVFIGVYSSMDFASGKEQCKREVDNYVPQEFPCAYSPSTGSTECFVDCVSYHSDFADCPEKVLHHAQRQLLRYRIQSFLRLAFFNPKLAAGNDLFKDNHLIYSHQNILAELNAWHCPGLGELDFEALYIDTALGFGDFALPLMVMLLLMVVPLAKLIFGDWATAWNVGCFFVAFGALCLTRSDMSSFAALA